MTTPEPVVFLLDVDNTVLDNDRIIADLKRHLAQAFAADSQASGAECADRLFPGALAVIERLRTWGLTVILSDGDVFFQPHKIRRSGLFEAVEGRVLVYIHKEQELDDVEKRYPARHDVLGNDKLRILAAVRKVWGSRVTTVFPRQGRYAHEPEALAGYPPANITIEDIADLLRHDVSALLLGGRAGSPGAVSESAAVKKP